jgi:hypothetical protein
MGGVHESGAKLEFINNLKHCIYMSAHAKLIAYNFKVSEQTGLPFCNNAAPTNSTFTSLSRHLSRSLYVASVASIQNLATSKRPKFKLAFVGF